MGIFFAVHMTSMIAMLVFGFAVFDRCDKMLLIMTERIACILCLLALFLVSAASGYSLLKCRDGPTDSDSPAF